VYLKSLVIKGFKSFADRSVVNFEPGISVIVGPNGSGKSNISEAVLWVLGERNARNMRVQAMEELIFSGSSARQAVGVAEVDLILDNADGKLPIEFDQVAITRRMYRSGESEYFINGSPCRQMDIIDILYDTGIGQGAHSIISQGNLTAMLESRPEDRRTLIEEAAGVLKHKRRKEKANRKLAAMDASLERVNDIIRIIESQLKPLERQANRAKQHASLVDELRELDLSLAVDGLRLLQTAWNKQDRIEKEVNAEAGLAHITLNEKESELEKRQLTLEEKGLFAGDLNEQRIRCTSLIQRLDAGMLLLEEKGKNMVSRLSDLRATVYNSSARLKAAETEKAELGEIIREGEGTLKALYAEFNELSRQSETLVKDKKGSEETYSQLSASLRGHESALETTRMSLSKATDSLSSLDLEEGLLKERYEQMEQEYLGTQTLLVERRAKLDDLERGLAKSHKDSELAKYDIDKFVRILDDRRQKLEAQRDLLGSIRAELKAVEEIDRAFEAASPALSWVLAHEGLFKGSILPISQTLTVAQAAKKPLPLAMSAIDLERLVERLLGADLFGVFVKDPGSAREIAQNLLEESDGKGEISIVPLEGIRYIRDQGLQDNRLLDYLDYPDELREAYEALLGDVYLVETLEEAQGLHLRDRLGVRFVTKDGTVVWPTGKLTLGIQVNDIEGVLTRRRKTDALGDDLEKATAHLTDIELEVSTAEQNLQVAQQDDFEFSQTLAKLQGDADSAREEVTRLEEAMTQMLYRRREVEHKLRDVDKRRVATTPLAGEYSKRIEHLQTTIGETTGRVDEASQVLLRMTEERSALNERISECKIRLETSKGSASYNNSRMATLEHEVGELRHMLEVSQQTEATLDAVRSRVDPLYRLYEELHAGAKVWAEKLNDQAAFEQTDSSNLRKVIGEANKAVEDARHRLEGINERLTEVRIEKRGLETEVEHAIRRIVDENGTTLETALAMPSPENRTVTEERANRLRRKITSIGAVNHVAMEEYNALKARRDYMVAQTDDLEEARKSLAKISAALDRKMRNQFLETFEQVNQNFVEIFSVLFPGGAGQLILTEGESPEQNGIEVSAQPKGKKIAKLSLMSGGEKSLAALALLFAVYRIREAPFYILDEVEAALDDTNLKRLLEYFEQLRDKTQLILVTHQRRTMETADVLYGVTMQASGVSKLVSQRLDQALRHAAKNEQEDA